MSIRFMAYLIGPGVFQPGQVELLTSEDGENFISRGIVLRQTVPADDPGPRCSKNIRSTVTGKPVISV
ncbi:MAG: hypothetical protein ACLR6J_18345 [Parabacteroides merdae]